MVNYKVILLAAGRGRRLRPITDKVPKALIPLNNSKRLIDYTLSAIGEADFRDIVIIIGYKASLIMEYVSTKYQYPKYSVRYVYNKSYNITNTAYSLWLASPELARGAIIVNGDVPVTPLAFCKLLQHNGTCIGVSYKSICKESVKVIINDEGKVKSIGKNVDGIAEYVGVAKIEPHFGALISKELDSIVSKKNGRMDLYYDDVINSLLDVYEVYTVDLSNEPLIDIDTIEDLQLARNLLKRRLAKGA